MVGKLIGVFRRRLRPDERESAPDPGSVIKTDGSSAVGARAGTLVLPTTALLEQILDEYGLTHAIDDDGDLLVRWEKATMYFFHYGERREVLQARMYLNRRFAVELRSDIVLMLDDWNRTKLFPKAYTVLPDDGMVGVCAEQVYDFEVGATRAQIKYSVGSWVDTLLRFVEWLDEQV
ncbi:MAG: YbjN domain-containing protein [Actinomycetia bacterium]|nr:YbjN domain-containing protein [Actinomycetes bacterium]